MTKIERVTWIDSGLMIDDGWQNVDFYVRQAKDWVGEVTTVGGVIYEDERVLVVGLSYDTKNEHWFAAQLIDKRSIQSRQIVGAWI